MNGNTLVLHDGRLRRLIECLIELVLSCKEEKEETVQINMIHALGQLLTSNLYHVNGEPLTSVLSALINIYSGI
jgi:hypothetical protein